MLDLAIATLERNWRDGYTVPSPRLYPFQWNWDAGFIALGHAYTHPERAIAEIRSMFRAQWRNGMLPHIAFHRPDPGYFPGPEVWRTDQVPHAATAMPTSGITQPPVFGFILERITALPAGRTPAWGEFLREIFPQVVASHRYLYTHRDPQQEGLVYIQHNWEAGTDNSPVYDAALERIDLAQTRDVSALRRDNRAIDAAHRPTDINYRRYIYLVDLFVRCGYRDAMIAAESPFLVQDVLFNALLARSNFALIKLARVLGVDSTEIEAWNARTIAAIHRKFWDEEAGFFFPFDLRANRRIAIKTSSGFMPLFAGICRPAQRDALARHLEHSFPGGPEWKRCPSVAADEPVFDPIKYWRGPVWVNVNWMLHHGLMRAGLHDLAARLKADTFALMGAHGMWEYFDPRPAGKGLGTDGFSWTAALALDWSKNPEAL
jgi:hypothetical protein